MGPEWVIYRLKREGVFNDVVLFEFWERYGYNAANELDVKMTRLNESAGNGYTFIALPQTYVENIFKNVELVGNKGELE